MSIKRQDYAVLLVVLFWTIGISIFVLGVAVEVLKAVALVKWIFS